MTQISNETKFTNRSVRYWMEKYNIKRRPHSEAAYMRANPDGDPFVIKKHLNKHDVFLLGLGLGIFWGEGTKTNKNSVRIANTDPNMILKFKKFLQEICGVRSNKFQYALVCFNDTSDADAAKYWSTSLEISTQKFGKIVKIPTQGKGTYKRKSKYGVCTLIVNNIKLKNWIDTQLKNL